MDGREQQAITFVQWLLFRHCTLWHARHDERDQRVEPSSAHRKNSSLKPTQVVNMLAVFGVTLSTNVRR
ncbi:hypothetical protein Bpfe_030320 [Biomphalaria pfeifferi]|uniref:Uncharacterized protein n=1 Tax=Biomphalaria pfeifferi TaxID=112525 RepID=A0AAD8EV12_BIOPF|nr:hypothetical protein Bpfe_030320 [Biomphalaria pfeifferi]